MKTSIRYLGTAMIVAATAALALAAAENKPTPKDNLRVLSGPGWEHRRVMEGGEALNVEKETVAFLGVETSPVSATVSAQLALPRGTGLDVVHLVPKSPAAESLQPHDILLKLDDQILIEVRQLAVLVRNHHEGDEVTISYLRAGQKATAKIKLAKQEVPKFSEMSSGAPQAFGMDGGWRRFEWAGAGSEGERDHVDRVLSLIDRARSDPGMPEGNAAPRVRIQADPRGGPGFRAMSVHTGNSNLVFSDEAGSLELTIKDGAKSLVAKNAEGEQIFSGPVATPEERKAMPEEVRQRLEKLEGMRDVTFRTDGDFQSGEMRVFRPRGIALPFAPSREPAERPAF